MNLLCNAAKFSGAGSRIRFSAEPDRDEIVLRIVDDGIGQRSEFIVRLPALRERRWSTQ